MINKYKTIIFSKTQNQEESSLMTLAFQL